MAAKKKRTGSKTARKRAASGKAAKKATPRKKAVGKKKASRKQASRSSAARDVKPIIVYVHGIGDHPPKEEFKRAWDLSLFGRDMGAQTRMAYWADILHDQKKARGKRTRRASAKPAPLEAAALLREANLDPDDERALDLVEALAARLAAPGSPSRARRGIRTKVLPLPGFLRRPIAERLLRWFVKDTAAYFFDDKVRQRIKGRLLAELPGNDAPFILVTHSQGTIVGFEVLSELRGRHEVPLFTTMGSPLGIQEVQDLLEDGGFPLDVPGNVSAWHNFSDRLDPVALDATLGSEFEPRGSVHDHAVVNQRTRELLRFNPHSSVGYLANPTVRSIIHHGFRFDSASRFVVARDVAEGFVAVGERQPVLIEALHPQYWALGENSEELARREKEQAEEHPELRHLSGRIDYLAEAIETELATRARESGVDAKRAVAEAHVQRLRKYVAAHLTPGEITELAHRHKEFNVYAVWRSAEKRKLVNDSIAATKVDAGRVSYAAEGKGITWAVLDTGARWDHPHLEKAIVEVLDCTTDDDVPVKMTNPRKGDRDGHGTHVAGIIAGEYDDGRGTRFRGIAPRTKLIVYKVLDDDGGGEDAWIIKAIDDIYRRNDVGGLEIDGVNLSLGGPFDATVYGCGHSPICGQLRDIWRQGVLVCVAAGNEGRLSVMTGDGEIDLNAQLSIGDPANLEDCIAVGSVSGKNPHTFGTSYFSSRGPTADGRPKPDVVAPGERILSANAHFRTRGRAANRTYEDLYLGESGTSMACPHVSGLLAAFLSVRREFRQHPDEVKRILMDNCNDLGRDRYHQGAGLPNLMKMLLNT